MRGKGGAGWGWGWAAGGSNGLEAAPPCLDRSLKFGTASTRWLRPGKVASTAMRAMPAVIHRRTEGTDQERAWINKGAIGEQRVELWSLRRAASRLESRHGVLQQAQPRPASLRCRQGCSRQPAAQRAPDPSHPQSSASWPAAGRRARTASTWPWTAAPAWRPAAVQAAVGFSRWPPQPPRPAPTNSPTRPAPQRLS